ncbi:hypothetical protein AG4045_001616 [Apium graveolens]|uniref:Uncharacterized protein n=1 Tax=Apium graveolens TaxID=4045 RepID=A0A6L5BDF3_APIGR|nr:hypothetical protein AG4045_001616 [Apium graveolens]
MQPSCVASLLSCVGTPPLSITPLSITDFLFSLGASNSLFVPLSWSGRIWGPTLYRLDARVNSVVPLLIVARELSNMLTLAQFLQPL